MSNECNWTSDNKTRYCPICESDTSHLKTCPNYVSTQSTVLNSYDEDYFLRGKQTGKSLYENYRWLPELTVPMVLSMVRHLGIDRDDSILDFGCARGYVVKAFRQEGYAAWGYDISRWALDNADEVSKEYLIGDSVPLYEMHKNEYDWVVAKDVLEHILDLTRTIYELKRITNKGVFAIVPLGHSLHYDVPEYEMDETHIYRRPLSWWVEHFLQDGWSVEARYRVQGIKDNYAQYPTGNGFIVARKIGV